MSSPPESALPEPGADASDRPEAGQPLNGDGTTVPRRRAVTGRRRPAYSLASLGTRIRDERKAQGKTLREVADASGISTSFLSQVERDQAKPSVGTLHTIAEALGLTMADLFLAYAEDKQARARAKALRSLAQVIRVDERKGLVYPHSGIRNELLSPDLGHAIQMMWVTMPPGEGTGNRPLVHEGEECAVIVQGNVEIWVGEGGEQEHYVLGPGDSIYQSSTVPHRSRNIGDTDVIIVVAITPPSF